MPALSGQGTEVSVIDELREIVDRLADEQLDAYEAGFQDGLKAVIENVVSRRNSNPKLTRLSIEAVIAIVQSERRPHPKDSA